MATNAFNGRLIRCQVAATSSGSLVSFGGLQGATLTLDRPEISVVHQDTSGWEQTLAGIAKWTVRARTVHLSTAATQEQDTLRAAALAGTRKWFAFISSTSAGGQTWKGNGYVSGFDLDGDQTSPVMHNFSVAGDGAITES
jgi:predicted secreted protein